MHLEFFEEQVCFTTLMLTATSRDGKASTSSGFLVQADVPGLPGRHMTLLITCKHCLFGPNGMVSLRLHQKSQESPSLPDLNKALVIPPSF